MELGKKSSNNHQPLDLLWNNGELFSLVKIGGEVFNQTDDQVFRHTWSQIHFEVGDKIREEIYNK